MEGHRIVMGGQMPPWPPLSYAPAAIDAVSCSVNTPTESVVQLMPVQFKLSGIASQVAHS